MHDKEMTETVLTTGLQEAPAKDPDAGASVDKPYLYHGVFEEGAEEWTQ